MTPRTQQMWLAGALLTVAASVIRMPAGLFVEALPKSVTLSRVEGSLWTGRASALGINGLVAQESIEWRFLPRALLSGRLEWVMRGRYRDETSRLAIAFGPGGLGLRDVSLAFPMEPVASLHPVLNGIKLGADARLTSDRIGFGSPASVAIELTQVFSSKFAETGQLGSYRIDLRWQANGSGEWKIATHQAPFSVTGEGSLSLNPASANGKLKLTPKAAFPRSASLLSQLPRAENGYQITF